MQLTLKDGLTVRGDLLGEINANIEVKSDESTR
jgi:hypothetical protein